VRKTWTLRDYLRIQQHWVEVGPPAYVTLALQAGIASGRKKKKLAGDLSELVRMFDGGVIS